MADQSSGSKWSEAFVREIANSGRKPFTEEGIKLLIASFVNQVPDLELAAKFGVTRQAVQKRRKLFLSRVEALEKSQSPGFVVKQVIVHSSDVAKLDTLERNSIKKHGAGASKESLAAAV
ncbi:hypothetical protein [Alteromonas macleodii]|uniref:TrfB transcriptional repressor protein domain-containing protein n=1 Tax=Alteromonas macleodii TaxID=28108 RepID=A0AB36FNQ3_ALTMA|nr:hypothetical protein [Alteromonas macleodii]OES24460.1 hypothetical protein BFV95_4727 [Alteromonas macleodii]OES25517.1 hypothetical protein BFV94_4370 [Alteromonas macleodii]OES25820.1 hypothetical protein BFV93_4283 [Alteromonas macleodii]OES38661.1 hypothetical protein BFV96_4772 [Alteromonas macleodii]